jgi:hypothetical protein
VGLCMSMRQDTEQNYSVKLTGFCRKCARPYTLYITTDDEFLSLHDKKFNMDPFLSGCRVMSVF